MHSDAESSASQPELIVVQQEHQEDDGNKTERGVNHNQYVASGGLQANEALRWAKTDLWEVIYHQMLTYHTDNTLPLGMDSAQTKQFRDFADKYLVQEGVLYYKFSGKGKEVKLLRVIRNEKERMEIIKKCHEDCNKLKLHNSRNKIIDRKRIVNDVKSYVS